MYATEETNLRAWASKVRTKHYNPRSLVVKVLPASLETILEQFDVSATTVATLLVLDLILNDKGLVRNIDSLVERSRDGMVGSDTLRNEAKVAFDDRRGGIFN
jgi:hypothetical protein